MQRFFISLAAAILVMGSAFPDSVHAGGSVPDLCAGTISVCSPTNFKTVCVQIQNKGKSWSKACPMRLNMGGFTTFVTVPAIPPGGSYTASVAVPISLHGQTVSVNVDPYHVNATDPNWANNAKFTIFP